MTNPTPHGQVPEALIDLIDAYAETRHRCGGVYNARTEAARKAVIEALSGMQALSAAPAVPAGWKAVPVNPTPEMWKAAKTVPDPNPPYPPHYGLVWDAMLAASPTPPAEQQAAPKAAPTLPEGWTDCTIEFGNDGPEVVAYGPKRMMNRLAKWLGKYFAQVIADAATKAAPGEPSDADIDAFLDSPGGIEWVIADKRERYRLLVRAVLAKWAAPQQEAQEPGEIPESIERMATDRYKVVPSHKSMFYKWAVVAGSGTQQLYLGSEVECQNMVRKFAGAFLDGAFVTMQSTSPNPAPAPVSECLRLLNSFEYEGDEDSQAKAFFKAHINEDWFFHVKNSLELALAAQGGKA